MSLLSQSDGAVDDSLFVDGEGEVGTGEQFRATAVKSSVKSKDHPLRECFVHACTSLAGMNRGVMMSLLRHVGAAPNKSVGRSLQVAAELFGVPLAVARGVWQAPLICKKGGIAGPAGSTAAPAGVTDVPLLEEYDPIVQDPAQACMTNIVRLVISSAAEGRSWLSFERHFARHREHPWICYAAAAAGQAM